MAKRKSKESDRRPDGKFKPRRSDTMFNVGMHGLRRYRAEPPPPEGSTDVLPHRRHRGQIPAPIVDDDELGE
jgi:hypothetical protein